MEKLRNVFMNMYRLEDNRCLINVFCILSVYLLLRYIDKREACRKLRISILSLTS